MKIFKSIIMIPIEIIKYIYKGLLFLSLLLSRGFYFYVTLFFKLLKKIFHFKFFDKTILHFEKRKEEPEFLLVIILWAIAIVTLYNILYINDDQIVNLDDEVKIEENSNVEVDEDKVKDKNKEEVIDDANSLIVTEMNPFRIYGKIRLDEVDFNQLKQKNPDTVVWLSVDRTNINYPIVQTNDNDFYLDHTFDKSYRGTGWTFMDYRNNSDMSDSNTIFYGHNLLNKTSFGSVSNIFTNEWQKNSNKRIVVLTDNFKYYYTIFSAYYIDPEVYYLQTNFASDSEKLEFLNTLKSRSIIDFGESVDAIDDIITLSTCTEDNKGRKVIHAKLIAVNER